MGDRRHRIKNHVRLALPELCRLPAAEITPGDIRDILTRLIDQGKGRTAAKVRSFLLAAFNQAMRAAFDPTTPMRTGRFFIEHNPVGAIPALSQFNRASHRVLTWEELDAYHKALLAHQGNAVHDALLVALYLGGQRLAQLLRLTPDKVDLTAGTLTLFDPKEKRRQPRLHVLPTTDPVKEIIERRLTRRWSSHFIASDEIAPVTTTLYNVIHRITRHDSHLQASWPGTVLHPQ